MKRVAAIVVVMTCFAVAVVGQQSEWTSQPSGEASQEPTSDVVTILEEMQAFEAPELGILLAPAPHGELLLIGIRPGSPAERAGLRRGDFVVKIDGQDVPSIETLKAAIQRGPQRESAKLTVWRGGKESEREIYLLPAERAAEFESRPWVGMQCDEVPGQGLVVKSVVPGGPADEAGLEVGDVIDSADGESLKTFVDAEKFIQKVRPFADVQVAVLRNGERRTLDVKTARLRETPEGLVIENDAAEAALGSFEHSSPQAMALQQERWEAEQRQRLEHLLQEIRHDLKELKSKLETTPREQVNHEAN